jgi:type IV fimbrial biogenesis protein FimT
MQCRGRQQQRGVTLIEACMVIAISSIVVGITAPGMQGLIEGRRLGGAATQLASDIQWVRTEAVVRNQAVRVSFHAYADSTCYVVHTGSAAQCSCDTSGPAVCSAGAEEIKTVHLPAAEKVTLQANVGSVLFDPLHGTSTPTGTLRLVGTSGREVHHVVNIMGRVRSCTPLGAVPGYRAC